MAAAAPSSSSAAAAPPAHAVARAHLPSDVVPVLDAAAEAAILSRLVNPVAPPGQGKKRKRDVGVCHNFAAGNCAYGDRCRFSHDAEAAAALTSAPQAARLTPREVLRAMTVERAERIAGAHGEAAGAGAGGEGAGAGAAAAAAPGAGVGEGGEVLLPVMSASRMSPFTMVQRYYTQLFAPDVAGVRGEDHYIYLQSNRVAILGLAPSHPAIRLGVPVVRVEFAPAFAAVQVSGKKKRGAVWADPRQAVATVHLADGRAYTVRACIRASVLSMNERLLTEPGLLNGVGAAVAGHIALLDCKLQHVVEARDACLDEAAYRRLCALRGLPGTPEEVRAWAAAAQAAAAVERAAAAAGGGDAGGGAGGGGGGPASST
jgi:hypothetical protein